MITQKEKVKTYFDDAAEDYACAYDKNNPDSLRSYIFLSRREYVKNMLGPQSGNVLDIGCGPAVLTEELLNKGCQVWNIDISEAMVERARQRMRFANGRERLHFCVGDIERLEFPDKFFDAVLCIGVLEYLTDDAQALREISRVLKPGGNVIFTVPNLASPFALLEKTVVFIVKFFLKASLASPNSLLFRYDIIDRFYFPPKFNAELKEGGFTVDGAKFHVYRLAFLNNVSPKLSLSFAKGLEILSKTPLFWTGVNYIVKAHKE